MVWRGGEGGWNGVERELRMVWRGGEGVWNGVERGRGSLEWCGERLEWCGETETGYCNGVDRRRAHYYYYYQTLTSTTAAMANLVPHCPTTHKITLYVAPNLCRENCSDMMATSPFMLQSSLRTLSI